MLILLSKSLLVQWTRACSPVDHKLLFKFPAGYFLKRHLVASRKYPVLVCRRHSSAQTRGPQPTRLAVIRHDRHLIRALPLPIANSIFRGSAPAMPSPVSSGATVSPSGSVGASRFARVCHRQTAPRATPSLVPSQLK